MKRAELTSPLARAILPVIGGLAGFAVLFGLTWVLASLSTSNRQSQPETMRQTFSIGKVTDIAEIVANSGPILYPDLRDSTGKRSIVIDHRGSDPARGWQVYYAYPADRDESCLVEQVELSRNFVDCTGRKLDVKQLALPIDVRPIVENSTRLLIDLGSD